MNRECIVLAADDIMSCPILCHAAVERAVNHSLVEINRIAVRRCRHVRRIRRSIAAVDIARNSDAVTERYLIVAQGRDLRRRRYHRRCRCSCRRRIAAVDIASKCARKNLDGIVCCCRAVAARYIACKRISREKAKYSVVVIRRSTCRTPCHYVGTISSNTNRAPRYDDLIFLRRTGTHRITAIDGMFDCACFDKNSIPGGLRCARTINIPTHQITESSPLREGCRRIARHIHSITTYCTSLCAVGVSAIDSSHHIWCSRRCWHLNINRVVF